MFHALFDRGKQHRNSKKIFFARLCTVVSLLIISSLLVLTGCSGNVKKPATPTGTATPKPATWEQKVSSIRWVAYSPPSANPNKNIEASIEAISEDLAVLRRAGFTGLVTYGASGRMGHDLPTLAQSAGFQGLIMGIWDPTNQEEIANAKAAAKLPITLGFCIGNEGLHQRYELPVLSAAIESLRKSTGKPVTTTEEIDDYSDNALLQLGDWVFPNAHPYFHNQLDPDAAVRWTQAAYDDTVRRAGRFVMFKEVGLPTAGGPGLSEANQARYYQELAKTSVHFVYFEAFDQPWKTDLPVEPHWGIFHSDRTPKLLAADLMNTTPPTPTPSSQSAFYIYQDADSPNNHYTPTGYMGDIGDIHLTETFEGNPHSGKTSIRVIYDAKGKGPNECAYSPPCKWAGVYWQEPPNNWGTDAFWAGSGFDLSDYSRLLFWARADKPCTVQFEVGGISGPYGDSLAFPRSINAQLTTDWQEFEIDLDGADLTHIIGGFAWVTNWDTNPNGTTFYLDDIRFEKK
jgi:exo-beta-1,3-glucanase (GH17 family)